jgi:hypothetical protein
MTTHESKLGATTIAGFSGYPAIKIANDTSFGSTGINTYQSSGTTWVTIGNAGVVNIEHYLNIYSGVDGSYSCGTLAKRWSNVVGAVLTTKNHANFTGSQGITSSGAVQSVNASTVNVFNSFTLLDNSGTSVEAMVVARDTGGANRGMAVRRALFTRQAGGAATLVGTVQDDLTNMPAAWGGGVALTQCNIAASANGFVVTVQGAAATTINWACFVRYQTVSGNT